MTEKSKLLLGLVIVTRPDNNNRAVLLEFPFTSRRWVYHAGLLDILSKMYVLYVILAHQIRYVHTSQKFIYFAEKICLQDSISTANDFFHLPKLSQLSVHKVVCSLMAIIRRVILWPI